MRTRYFKISSQDRPIFYKLVENLETKVTECIGVDVKINNIFYEKYCSMGQCIEEEGLRMGRETTKENFEANVKDFVLAVNSILNFEEETVDEE